MPIAPAAGSLKPRQPLSLNRIYFTGETSRQAKFAFGGVRPADAVSVAHTLAYIRRVKVHCSNAKHSSKQFSLSMTDIEHALHLIGESASTIVNNPGTIATCNNASAMAQLPFNRQGRNNDHFRRRVGISVFGFLGLAFALGRQVSWTPKMRQ
jgi:hypothetical protein